MSIHVLKRNPNRLSCPAWCTTDHGAFLESDLREHCVTLAVVDTVAAGRRASVNVSVCDDLDEGTRSAPAVFVWGADEGLAPAAALELARGLTAAARLVEDEQAGR